MVEERTSESRLSSLETEVRHLDQGFNRLSHEMADGFASLRRALESQKQPVTAFAGWAAVVLTLVAAVMWPMIKNDDRTELHLVKLSEAFVEHVRDGHPYRVEQKADALNTRLTDLEARFHDHELLDMHGPAKVAYESLEKRLDTEDEDLEFQVMELQREMNQLVEAEAKVRESQIKNLDDRLQREARDLDELNYWKSKAEQLQSILDEKDET